MTEWKWVNADLALTINLEQLAEHGGGEGVRDEGMLHSALARPQHLAAYGDPDMAALAAAYAFGIARNHPFVDGNKRTAWVVMRLFLLKNGVTIRYRDADATITMLALAAGEIGEETFADWIRDHSVGS